MSAIFGELTYDNKKYHFEYEDYLLQIYEFGSELISDIAQAFSAAITINQERPIVDSLDGVCYPDGHSIVFFDIVDAGAKNNILLFRVRQYVEYKKTFGPLPLISCIAIEADELNYIYPIEQAYQFELGENGISKILLPTTTESEQWLFNLDDNRITVSFGIRRKVSSNESPLLLQSGLFFEFAPTQDYAFISRLFGIGRNFLRYVCYRRNINITAANIYAHDEEQHIVIIGSFDAGWLYTLYPETKQLMKRYFVPISLLCNSLSFIFQQLSDDTLYLRHIPESIKDARRITPAHSVMLTAAFEWEYSRLFPDGIEHKAKTLKKHELIKSGLDTLISDDNYKKVKGDFERAKSILTSDNLEAQLNHAFQELSTCFEVFAKRLFSLNNTTYSTSIMAKTISKMRNDFAHGNINIDYGVETYLSMTILPYLIYTMQLRQAGIDNETISRIINRLFDLHYAI